ncbi:hypothetical protein DFH06DRAFT_1122454 [Mycena polygramma]|nr:hypothetical protein DFH06DRAFT_1122454 [Mycena polygramma]
MQMTRDHSEEYPFNLDFSSGQGLGFGWLRTTVGHGARSTSASAYLHPALNTRSNLDVLLHSQVTQVVSTSGNLTFNGVQVSQSATVISSLSDLFELQNTRSMRRKKVHPISMFNFGPLKFGVPVILSAGSIGTPQLLMLSGIGPKQQLQSLGISSLVDLEDVGANLQDQSILTLQWEVNATTLSPLLKNGTALGEALAQWEINRTGIAAGNTVYNTIGAAARARDGHGRGKDGLSTARPCRPSIPATADLAKVIMNCGSNWIEMVQKRSTHSYGPNSDAQGQKERSPCHGRGGRFFTARESSDPCRDRTVEQQRKCSTERARHPWHGCRRTVGTVTGGSPSLPDNSTLLSAGDPAAGPNSPHFQFAFIETFYANPGEVAPTTGNWMSVSIVVQSPTSRGSLNLTSSSAFVHPTIDPAYYTTAFDIGTAVHAIRALFTLLATSAWDDFIIAPYSAIAGLQNGTDTDIEAYIRQYANSIWHPTSTARISTAAEKGGVVGPDLCVKGTEGLRVVDASILPSAVAGFPQAEVYIVAERAADLIKSAWAL